MKKVVQFLKPWKIYSPGDVAGFDAEQAEALIKANAAEAFEEKPKTAKTEK